MHSFKTWTLLHSFFSGYSTGKTVVHRQSSRLTWNKAVEKRRNISKFQSGEHLWLIIASQKYPYTILHILSKEHSETLASWVYFVLLLTVFKVSNCVGNVNASVVSQAEKVSLQYYLFGINMANTDADFFWKYIAH